MKYKADWMVIEAYQPKNDFGQVSKLKDKPLLSAYWEAVEMENEEANVKTAEEIKAQDNSFRLFLQQSGIIDSTLKHLFEKYKTAEKVKEQIKTNRLDELAKYYNLSNEFNQAYAKYKRLSK
jgi:hypothetical protein